MTNFLSVKRSLSLGSLVFLFCLSGYAQDTTWYTLASGNWDDPTIWTLDPSGSLPKNPGNFTPTTAVTGTSHRVVVNSGHNVLVTSNNKNNARLTVNGRIELNATTGHSFGTIRGGGKIVLKADNFPAGDATHFVTAGLGQGTVVFDSANYTLSATRTFYNVEMELDNPADSIILLNNYTINGNLSLVQGRLKINNNLSTALLDLNVAGNVTVSADASIGVGRGNAYNGALNYYNRVHDFYIGGDFVSYGVVRLTNQAVPDYLNQTTTGAVTLHFTGASDNYFKVYNTTDVYNFHVNKGTDKTYELSLYVHNKAYFALFGPNSAAYTRTVAHPQHDKALWVQAGTLRLKGEIVIPSLSEGGNDWSIGANAALVLDGENVQVYTTVQTGFVWTGFSHAQPLNIDVNTGNQGVSVYGDLVVENGFFSTANSAGLIYRPEAAGSVQISGGEISISQLRLSGAAGTGYYSYVQSGGIFRARANGEISGTAALFSLNDPNMYFSMSGGQLIVQAQTGYVYGAIDIQCAEGNYYVTGGEVICDVGASTEVYILPSLHNFTITNATAVVQYSLLKVLNDLSISGNSALNAAGFDLSIGRNLLFANGAVFTHGNNTTYFNGAQDSDIDIDNTSNAPAITFYNLTIDKDQRSNPSLFYDVSILECLGRSASPAAAANTIMRIANNLTINRGQLTVERYTVSLYDSLNMTDGKIIYNASLPGRITMEGPAAQVLTGSAIYNPVFGNIELDNANGAAITTDVTMENFIITTGLLNIRLNQLTIDTSFVENGNAVAFSATKMIQNDNNHGARGVKMKLNGNYAGTTTRTYPVGVAANYCEFRAIIGAIGNTSGYLTVVPVGIPHPTSASGGCDRIDAYWKTRATGFSGITTGVSYSITCPFDAPGGGAFEYYFINGVWTADNAINPPGTMIFENADLDGFPGEADFTIAKNPCFNTVETFYSVTTGNWNVAATWDRNAVPQTTDYVYIRKGHTVTVVGATNDAGKVTIESGGTLNVGTITGLVYNIVKGGGTIRMASNTMPTADYYDMIYNDTATFEFYGAAYTLPASFAVYPNLRITGTGIKTMPNQSLLVRKNLFIDAQTFSISGGYSLNVTDSLIILNNGVLRYPTNTTSSQVTVGRSIDMGRTAGTNTINMVAGGTLTTNHRLTVKDDIILGTGSVVDLYDAANKACDLYLTGDFNSQVNNSGTTFDLHRLIIDKTVATANVDLLNSFTLNGATNGASTTKALYLLNGDLTISNAVTDITLTSGGGEFAIPSTSSLTVQNATVRASGTNTGIFLDGLMRVGDNSQWLLNGGSNNYIRYSASGSASIQIDQGTLRVGSQIRRNTITDDGILTFAQNHANSTVVIGETNAPENRRGLLEVLNTGSSFTQAAGANITIVRAQTAPAAPALYLDPTNTTIGIGATITFGNATTPATQSMRIYSVPALQNLVVNNSSGNNPTVIQNIVPLTLLGNLTIQSGATFNANGLNLILGGNLYNSGNFVPAGNTTFFSGISNQRIVGNTSFYNLTKTSFTELWLALRNAAITVTNTFDMQAGNLRDSSNTVTLLGDCNFDGTHLHGAQGGEGFYFNGTTEQDLTGSGVFGKITVNNPAGVFLPLGNNFTVTDTLKLSSGVFAIGRNLLTLTVNAVIEEDNPFSATNMIQTNVSFTDYGVRKYMPSGARTFVYPIGSGGKYTPVTFDITANASATGYITVKAADELHPSIQEDSEAPSPEIVDADNVLQYHWVLRAQDITGFSATAYLNYEPGDVEVTAPYDIYDYITARLLNDGSGNWNKFDDVDKVDEVNEWLVFDFTGVDDNQISGDYTAGVDGSSFNGAIPDKVPAYETNTSGTWSTGTIWTPNVAGGPRGAITRINATHTVSTPSNFVSSYSTAVFGRVEVNLTYGHRFGEVTGTGSIYTQNGSIPAGVYDQFFSAAGGTIEYGGTTDYETMAGQALMNNVTFNGSELRRLPNNNIELNGDFRIDGLSSLTVKNEYNKDISLRGDLIRINGAFDAGTNLANRISFISTVNQNITGFFTGANELHSMVVNNPGGITISSGTVNIAGTLYLTNGIVTTSATDTLRIGVTSAISPAAGSASAFINGPLTKVMSSGDDFSFPVGKSGNFGLMDVLDITGITGVDTDVSTEYFFSNPQTTLGSAMGTGVNTVSQTEYWSVDVAGGAQAEVKLYLDGSSDVANAVSNLSDLIMVGWNGSQWEQVGGTYTLSGTATSGSIACNDAINFNTYQYITVGSSVAITIITASIVSGDVAICSGASTNLLLAFTGGTAPWTYTLNGSDYVAAASPHVHSVSPAVTTTYTLTAVSDATPTVGIVVGNTDAVITVNATPIPTLSSSENPSCEGTTLVFTAGGGVNFAFYVAALEVQSGTVTTYTTSTLPVGTTELDVVVTSSAGCSSSLGVVPVSQVIRAVPAPLISGAAVSCEQSVDTYTTPASANTFLWSVTGGSLQTAQGLNSMDVLWSSLVPSGTLSRVFTISIEETDGVCIGTDSFSVTINRLPVTGPAHHISNTWEN